MVIVDCFTYPCSEFYLPFEFNVRKITAHLNHQWLTLKAWYSIFHTNLLLNNRIIAKHQIIIITKKAFLIPYSLAPGTFFFIYNAWLKYIQGIFHL